MSQHSSRSPEYQRNRLIVLERDNYTCQLCGKPGLEGDDATADHIVSKERWKRENRPGNPDDTSNLVACCRSCNSAKGNRDTLPRINYYNPRWFPQY